MIVDLTTIKDRQTAFDFMLAASRIDLESDMAQVKDAVYVAGKLKNGIAQMDVEGKISTVVEIECTRCLQKIEMPLEFPFKAVFISPEHYTREREAEINHEDLEVSISENDKVDLAEIAREQILLNLPERVLCREDCQGFCQKCGANRNLINCNCEEKEVDPRWAALKNLK